MWWRQCSQPWMHCRYHTGLKKEANLSCWKCWRTLALTEAECHVLHKSAYTVHGGDWWTWIWPPGTSLMKRTYSREMKLLKCPERRSKEVQPFCLHPHSLSLLRTFPSSSWPLKKHHWFMPRVDRHVRWHTQALLPSMTRWQKMDVDFLDSSAPVCCLFILLTSTKDLTKLCSLWSKVPQKYLKSPPIFNSSTLLQCSLVGFWQASDWHGILICLASFNISSWC